jgi:hypothetical protein
MKKDASLKKQGIFMLIVLVLQYILGMTANLFVTFPQTKNEAALWEFAWSQLPIAAHIIVGSLLLIGGITLFVSSIVHKNKNWIVASTIGALALIFAGYSGSRFIPTQIDAYSFTMSLGFIIAFVSYAWGVYVSNVLS